MLTLINSVSRIKEIQRFDEKVPVVLCGTKADLLDDAEVIRKIGERGEKPVSLAEGQEMAARIGAHGYYECSGKTQKGMNEVFMKGECMMMTMMMMISMHDQFIDCGLSHSDGGSLDLSGYNSATVQRRQGDKGQDTEE